MTFALWPKTKISLPTNVQRDFKGVNRLDPFSIPDDMATDMQNMTSSKYPALTVRPGFSVLGTAFAAAVLGLGVWKQTELEAISGGAWYKWTGSAWTSLKTGLNTAAQWSFANYKGSFSGINLIGANGVDPLQTYDGTTVSNLANAPANANYVEQFAERLWTVVGNDLHGCASGNATIWNVFNGDNADPYVKTVESPDGESIVAIKSGLSNLTIFKPNSIYKLFGYVPSDYTTILMTKDIGTLNNNCVVTIQGIMYILHTTGLYQYLGSTLPDRQFSMPIQWYIDNMNPSARNTCSLGTDGRKLYVSLPSSTASTPDTILEYDPLYQVWSVWNNFSPNCFNKIVNTMYTGDNSGRVLQFGGVSTDAGSAIAWRWVSKPFGSGSLAQRIRFNRMWVTASVPSGSTLNVYLSKSATGDSDWVLVQTIPADTVIEGTRVIIPTTTAANANFLRLKLEGTGPCDIKEISREEVQMPIY